MKKYLYLLLFALCMSACCSHETIEVPISNRMIFDLQANSNEWNYTNTDNNNYFVANFSMPEITKNIYDNGTILVYREFDYGTTNAVQQILPYSRHYEYLINANENSWGFYTETVDYEYGIGFLNIFYTASDFDYELNTSFVPEGMHFRMVIMW
ncbi:MAG: hypothetical protein NC038_08640 [Paludibacter sp.]|nr:hypothetical protein [Bacteroidales bacterium]MCM1069527.1 hypothetical protein [Prevotella sp.]MCM1354718.1 hypothetical protein [Bacteroides sp.]MCM1443549.1 hypothetical protein [Muribaculum sp.]MCM1482682.1 hypothetical protein [Paludibacter sp.]